MAEEERLKGCGTPTIALTYPLALICLPLLACCIAWPLSYIRRGARLGGLTMKVTDCLSATLLCIVFIFFLMLAADPSLFYVDDWHGECEDDYGDWEYGRPRDCRPVTGPLCDVQVSKEAKAGAAIGGIVVGAFTYLAVYLGCSFCRQRRLPHEDVVYVRHLDEVACPKGYGSGAEIVLELPAGQRVRTVVPRGIEAGMKFRVEMQDQQEAHEVRLAVQPAEEPVQLALEKQQQQQQQQHQQQQQEQDVLYPAIAAALRDNPLPEGQPPPEAIGVTSN